MPVSFTRARWLTPALSTRMSSPPNFVFTARRDNQFRARPMKGNSQRFTDAGRGAGDPDFTVVVRSTQHSALSIQQLVFGSRYLVLGTWYLVFGIWYFHVLVCPMQKHVRNIDIPDFETTQTPPVPHTPIHLWVFLPVSLAPWCKGPSFFSPPRFP